MSAVLQLLQEDHLDARDTDSFDLSLIQSQEDWEALLNNTWNDAEKFATFVQALPESKLWETFKDEKYGTYYRNIHGIIQPTHYHLGQIVLLKKILARQAKTVGVKENN